jgi:hypothetical protein
MHTTGSTVSKTVSSVRDRPMMSAMTTVARIWSARARSGQASVTAADDADGADANAALHFG